MTKGETTMRQPAGNDSGAARTLHGSSSTERVREFRQRRKHGLQLITVQVFNTEIDILVKRGLLAVDRRDDRRIAVAEALQQVIEVAVRALDQGELHV